MTSVMREFLHKPLNLDRPSLRGHAFVSAIAGPVPLSDHPRKPQRLRGYGNLDDEFELLPGYTGSNNTQDTQDTIWSDEADREKARGDSAVCPEGRGQVQVSFYLKGTCLVHIQTTGTLYFILTIRSL